MILILPPWDQPVGVSVGLGLVAEPLSLPSPSPSPSSSPSSASSQLSRGSGSTSHASQLKKKGNEDSPPKSQSDGPASTVCLVSTFDISRVDWGRAAKEVMVVKVVAGLYVRTSVLSRIAAYRLRTVRVHGVVTVLSVTVRRV